MADPIVTDIPPFNQYTSAGGVGPFNFAFLAFAQTDVVVYLTPSGTVPDDADNILTYNVDFTVALNALPAIGGSITLINASAAGDIITIVRAMPDNRLNNYIAGGLFQATTVNTDFDRTVLMAQQNKFYDQNIGVHYNISSTPVVPTDTVLPILPANCIWMKSADNTKINAYLTTGTVNPYSVALPTTDDAIARFDGVAGNLQNSGVLIDDANAITGAQSAVIGNLTYSLAGGNTITSANANGVIRFTPNGIGSVVITGTKKLRFERPAGGNIGTNFIGGANVADLTFTLPIADGAANTLWMTSGAAVLSFSTITGIPATKAQMEAAVEATAPVTAAKTQNHPGVAKAWVNFTPGTPPVVNSSYNVAGVARNADGDYTVTFTTAFANANYCLQGSGQFDAAASNTTIVISLANVANPNLVGSCRITTRRLDTSNLFQGTLVTVSFFGTQ